MLAPFATLLIVAGTLVILGCNTLVTGFFLRPPPRGEQAMGLVVFFVGFFIAAALILLASVLVSFRGGRPLTGLLGSGPALAGTLTVLVTFGVVLAAFMAFVAWVEPGTVGPRSRWPKASLCGLLGIAGPLLLAATLILDVTSSSPAAAGGSRMSPFFRTACWGLTLLAALGYLSAGVAVAPSVRSMLARAWNASAQRAARALPPGMTLDSALREELDKSLDKSGEPRSFADLLDYFAHPEVGADAACRSLLTERLLAFPEADEELLKAVRSRDLRTRWGGAEFVRTAPAELFAAHRGPWAQAIEAAFLETADLINCRPGFLTENPELNPEPHEFIRSLLGAADRFRGTPHETSLDQAARTLAESASNLKADGRRKTLAKVMKRAGYPIPDDR